MQKAGRHLYLAQWRPTEEVSCRLLNNPSSKSHIRELHARIARLEAALAEARSQRHPNPESQKDASAAEAEARSQNLIYRLTQRGWQLNSDAEGQYKFFGPTSSVHLTESISVSILEPWGETALNEDDFTISDIDLETQAHLLDLYWRFQHTVLQVFQKDTFLEGLEKGNSKYVSKALLYAVYACGARISPRADLKQLALPRNFDDPGEELPYLLAEATRHTEEELKRPQITTIQALLLLSVLYSAIGRDTKGWLLTGDACRLAIDLGIHKNTTGKTPHGSLSRDDVQARQLAFWACVVFDRQWALYLGRPHCLNVGDIAAQEATWMEVNHSWEAKMAYAWVSLLVIVGNICDVLNADVRAYEKLEAFDRALQSWQSHLDASLRYHNGCPASVSSLHLMFCAAMILLHQPTAKFGSRSSSESEAGSAYSRRQCITYSAAMASCLQNFQQQHGDVTTLSGVALHSIALASTTLVALIAEKKSADVSAQMRSLKTCVRALGELESTYVVARRARKIIQLIIRVCHLETDYVESRPRPTRVSASPSSFLENRAPEQEAVEGPLPLDVDIPDGTGLSEYSPFAFDEHLPMSAQFDVFHTFDAEGVAGQDPFQRMC
ncbi:hypothetical protein A1O7_09029 [Cladophialophora yegresii CBS 114405]|uniref:Xylanolytic transcriptional activator regulatory domain-containing protein n=1 Tax=Cladophialophora yegresii CBS 114405 TaxID=1182544 RepID=W9VKR6_9EURO|nr:uncharacterized protein A1O7_09029 [Cladophialophora yegresii CBS 114405]EXJ56098.1 hypothetical protein A1O7_09029 [Cladophialophora yegresii CBS 114405]